MSMKIYIDADACPVTRIAESIAKQHSIPVTLLCDTNHHLTSDYSTVKVIGAGADAVDIALINLCKRRDINSPVSLSRSNTIFIALISSQTDTSAALPAADDLIGKSPVAIHRNL